MTRLLTREQQKTLDVRFSEVTGLPSVSLMEQAASCMSEFIEWLTISHDIGEEYHVIYFTGAGNNGGDGWASARQLMASRRRVAVFDVYPDRELSPDAEINRSAYKKLGGEVITKKEDLANKKRNSSSTRFTERGLTSVVRSLAALRKRFLFSH